MKNITPYLIVLFSFYLTFSFAQWPSIEASFTSTVSTSNTFEYSFQTVDSSNINYFYWDFGDGISLSNPSFSQNHIFNTSGTYSVCASVQTMNQQCFDTVCQSITIGGLVGINEGSAISMVICIQTQQKKHLY